MNIGKHPQLLKKLTLLYSSKRHSEIGSHADLASALGISRQAVSKWAYGTVTTRGNRIPQQQLERIADYFCIPAVWFEMEYADFCEKLQQSLLEEESLAGNASNHGTVYLAKTTYPKRFRSSANQEGEP